MIEEANRGTETDLEITANMMNDRWPSRPDYDEDLLAYALTGSHGLSHLARDSKSRQVLADGDFAAGIHRVAYEYVREMTESLGFQATLASAVMTRYDPAVNKANGEVYELITEAWSGLYAETMRTRGLRLRPGITLQDFTYMLTAVADGIGLRMLTEADTSGYFIDHEKQETFLGKAVPALAVACFDPGDGMSHEELIRVFTGDGA